MKSSVIAYWLRPAGPAHEFFARTIHQLATRFDAPFFDPHLTLFVTPENSRGIVVAAGVVAAAVPGGRRVPHSPQEVARQIGSVTIALTATGIHCSEQFTKTLFVQFEETDALQELADTIGKLSGAPGHHGVDPHVSLLYKHLPEKTRRELAGRISLPFRTVEFQSLCAVHCASPTETAADVAAWNLLAS